MALWPNARYMTRSTYKGYGVAPGLDAYIKGNGDRYNRFLALNKTASTPDGYGMKTNRPPITVGSMSSTTIIETTTTVADVLQGGPVSANVSLVTLTESGSLSLVVGLSGTDLVVSLSGENLVLNLTIGLNGSGTFEFSGTNNLALIVPFEGSGSVITFDEAATDLRELLSLVGEWTPFTELSPENLASAVWNSVLAQYQDVGSTGEALAAAGSGGVNYNALAQAVWEYATRTLTSGGGGVTVDEIMTDPRMLTIAKFLGLK